jgi:pyridoxal phosphate enzyme (YggS family)
MNGFSYIKRNYDELTGELSYLSSRLGTEVPTLVSVTKSGSDEELIALMAAGARHIGENRPGEVQRRGALLRGLGYEPLMHEIGTLQRNKIKLVIDSAYMIHSVDSIKLAEGINRLAGEHNRIIPVLIEVNSARETQKSGVLPELCEELLYSMLRLENLRVSGLMTMGPVCEDAEMLRPYFRETKKLFDSLLKTYGFGDCPTLSMGMSDSYRVAIEEGSTLVRVGRRLFVK